MKIRRGFVTNSSSTSFIISLKEEWSKENFLKAIGIEGESPMNKIFEDLFGAVEENKQDILLYMKEAKETDLKAFLVGNGYSEDVIEEVQKLLDSRQKVWFGKLSSDGGSSAEVYFCMESFIICEENIYFNGQIGGW